MILESRKSKYQTTTLDSHGKIGLRPGMGVEPISPTFRVGILPLDDPGHFLLTIFGSYHDNKRSS